MENQEICTFVAAALISYLSGSVPYGYLIGKMKGIDIRQHGSCNIGATNVTRVLGKGWGRLCFACDFLKGCLPVFLLSLFFCKDAVTLKYLPVLCALFAVLGHIFPVWLKFKGGKYSKSMRKLAAPGSPLCSQLFEHPCPYRNLSNIKLVCRLL